MAFEDDTTAVEVEPDQALNVSEAPGDEHCGTVEKEELLSAIKAATKSLEQCIDFAKRVKEQKPVPRSDMAEGGNAVEDGLVSRIISGLQKFKDILHFIYTFLQEPEKEKFGQHENATLRGLLKLAEVSSIIITIGFLHLASEFLEIDQDFFKPELDFLKRALEKVRQQEENIGQLVQQASQILTDIIDETNFNSCKARQFDKCISEAESEIQQCQNTLAGASEVLQDAFWHVQKKCWIFAGAKYFGVGVLLYCSYSMLHKNATLPNTKKAVYGIVAGAVGFSMLHCKSSVAEKVYVNLKELKMNFRELQLNLKNMTIKMKADITTMSALVGPTK